MPKNPASENVESTPPKPPLRPNLSQSMSTGNDADRILSSINPSASTFKTNSNQSKNGRPKFATLLLATAALVGAGYWYVTHQNQTANQLRSSDISKADAGVTTAKADTAANGKSAATEPGPAPLGSVPSPPSTPPTEQAAQIVNEPKAPSTPGTSAQAQLTDALEKDVKPPEAALKKALESKAKPAGVTVTPKSEPTTAAAKSDSKAVVKTTPKADPRSSGTVVAKGNASGSSSVAKAGATPASKTASATVTKTAPPAGDKDANLIAALLAHNAATQIKSASPRPAAVKVASSDAANAQIKTDSATSGSSANKSAVAGRGDTTESVLKKCESLDFLQREVCRLKACDKLWESDSFCKATLTSAR